MRRPNDSRGSLAPLLALGVVAATLLLAGCGTSLKHAESADASADVDGTKPSSCGATVLSALGDVAVRVYREGIQGERVGSARHVIEGSVPLREAVEAGDAPAARAAGRALIATGHLTNLRVVRAGKVLVELGGPALAPLRGTIAASDRRPLASYVTSVWAASGLVAETDGIAEGQSVIRAAPIPSDSHTIAGHTIAGSFPLPAGQLPSKGTLTRDDVAYQFTSYPARSYPDGASARVFLLRALSSVKPLCGANDDDTTFNTIRRVARLIYDGEAGRRTGPQISRVQHNRVLLRAVALRDPRATRRAVEALLHQHIVRLRVSADGHLLADVGGPYVLAPVRAPLRLAGRTIGSFLLSIQDDEGYKRLANRLAGLDVLMYMGPRLVKSTVGYSPGPVPESGPVTLRRHSYRAYTFKAEAFPSGPLRITVLIPFPYS